MKNLKKIVSGLLGAAMFAVLVGPAFGSTYKTLDPNMHEMSWSDVGMKVARIEGSGSASVLASGAGLLFGLCASSNSITNDAYALAFDSASANGLAVTTTAKRISPNVYTSLATTTAQGMPNVGCWFPPVPILFSNGLAGITSASTFSTVYYYRLFSAANP
jgi:hypothetical protein